MIRGSRPPHEPQWGATPLHKAAEKGHADCATALLLRPAAANNTTITAALLDARCDDGMAPAHLAALHGQERCLLALLEHGAGADVANAARGTASGTPHFVCWLLCLLSGWLCVPCVAVLAVRKSMR